jgi:hypothetical protein
MRQERVGEPESPNMVFSSNLLAFIAETYYYTGMIGKIVGLFLLSIVISCASTGNNGTNTNPQTAKGAQASNIPAQAELTLDEAVVQAVEDIGGKLPKGTKIAVVSFASETAQVSEYIMEELNFALLNKGLIVTDRANLESVRKELDFHRSGEVDDNTIQTLGKFLGVEYVVVGQFLLTGESYRFRVTTERAQSAERVIASNLNVRNDSRLQKLIETLNKTNLQTHSAGY